MMKAPTPEQSSKLAELDAKLRDAEKSYYALEPSIGQDQAKWERRAAHNKELDWSPHDGLVVDRPQPVDFDGKTFVDGGDVANFDYLDPFTLAASIHPSSPDGAILTRVEDYFEGEGYGLYLINGKVRLHIIKRWTDIGLRVETENPIPLNEWSHVSATYDGYRYASGVRIYVNGQPQKLKVLFDDLNYPLGAKDPFRIGGGGGPKLRFQGSIRDVEVFKRALSEAEAGDPGVKPNHRPTRGDPAGTTHQTAIRQAGVVLPRSLRIQEDSSRPPTDVRRPRGAQTLLRSHSRPSW